MYVRPVKRICDVRGCRNKDCFSISRVKEAGNTPILCRSCLGMALSALDEPEVVKVKEKRPIPTLFFNEAAMGKDAPTEAATAAVAPDENTEAPNPNEGDLLAKIADTIAGEGAKAASEENQEAPLVGDTEEKVTSEDGKTADETDEEGKDAPTEAATAKPKRKSTKKGDK